MGRYYALEAGEKPEVADAARDHWKPKGEGDSVPSDPVSVAVALADKLDTLTGFWAIDEKPTGSKDPFALRRAALGVIRLVLGNGASIALHHVIGRSCQGVLRTLKWKDRFLSPEELIAQSTLIATRLGISVEDAVDQIEDMDDRAFQAEVDRDTILDFPDDPRQSIISADLLSFFHDRLKVFLKDQGIRPDIIDACIAMPGNDDLTLLVKRATALAETMKTEDGANLLQGYKRANNILTQAEAKDGVEYSFGADVKFAEGPEETALFAALDKAEAIITPAMAAEDFATAMRAMAALRAPIDAFFGAVQINADSDILRRNRLNLLHRIRSICSGVADLTRIEG